MISGVKILKKDYFNSLLMREGGEILAMVCASINTTRSRD